MYIPLLTFYSVIVGSKSIMYNFSGLWSGICVNWILIVKQLYIWLPIQKDFCLVTLYHCIYTSQTHTTVKHYIFTHRHNNNSIKQNYDKYLFLHNQTLLLCHYTLKTSPTLCLPTQPPSCSLTRSLNLIFLNTFNLISRVKSQLSI